MVVPLSDLPTGWLAGLLLGLACVSCLRRHGTDLARGLMSDEECDRLTELNNLVATMEAEREAAARAMLLAQTPRTPKRSTSRSRSPPRSRSSTPDQNDELPAPRQPPVKRIEKSPDAVQSSLLQTTAKSAGANPSSASASSNIAAPEIDVAASIQAAPWRQKKPHPPTQPPPAHVRAPVVVPPRTDIKTPHNSEAAYYNQAAHKPRGERRGFKAEWYTKLHAAKRLGPEFEAKFRKENPMPEKS